MTDADIVIVSMVGAFILALAVGLWSDKASPHDW